MAGSREIRAGKAFVELSLKDSFSKALDGAKKKLEAFGESLTKIGTAMSAMGAAIVAPLALAAQQFASMGDEVNKASQRTGVAVEELSALKYAAEQSGASFEDLQKGIQKMQKAVFEAAEGSKTAQQALASLGLAASDLQSLSPDEQFTLIADRLADVQDAGTRAAVAMEVFGKGGATLLPLILEGADGIKALTDRAKELGLTFNQVDADAATTFGDTLDDIQKQLAAITFQIGAAVANALQPFADGLIDVLTGVIGWVKENRSLVTGVLAVGAALVAAGTALVGLGLGIKVTMAAMSGFSAVAGFITTALGAMLNPVVLIGAGLVALAAYFVYTSETGAAAIGWLKNKFGELATTVQDTVGGITDALAAGDIGLAAQILWAGLKLAFAQGTNEVQQGWIKFKALFVQTAAAAFYGAQEIWANVKANLLTAFENTTAALGSLWDGFIGVFTSAWNTAINAIAKGMNWLRGQFDETFDADAANQMADNMLAQEKAAREAAELAKAKQRESERQTALKDIEAERKRVTDELNKREMALNAAADQNAKDDIAALNQQKSDLDKQLADLRNRAKSKREEKDSEGPSSLAKPGIDLEDVLKNRAAVEPVNVKAAGTFNAAAVGLLGGVQVADQIAKATKETAQNTAKIARMRATFK